MKSIREIIREQWLPDFMRRVEENQDHTKPYNKTIKTIQQNVPKRPNKTSQNVPKRPKTSQQNIPKHTQTYQQNMNIIKSIKQRLGQIDEEPRIYDPYHDLTKEQLEQISNWNAWIADREIRRQYIGMIYAALIVSPTTFPGDGNQQRCNREQAIKLADQLIAEVKASEKKKHDEIFGQQ